MAVFNAMPRTQSNVTYENSTYSYMCKDVTSLFQFDACASASFIIFSLA